MEADSDRSPLQGCLPEWEVLEQWGKTSDLYCFSSTSLGGEWALYSQGPSWTFPSWDGGMEEEGAEPAPSIAAGQRCSWGSSCGRSSVSELRKEALRSGTWWRLISSQGAPSQGVRVVQVHRGAGKRCWLCSRCCTVKPAVRIKAKDSEEDKSGALGVFFPSRSMNKEKHDSVSFQIRWVDW